MHTKIRVGSRVTAIQGKPLPIRAPHEAGAGDGPLSWQQRGTRQGLCRTAEWPHSQTEGVGMTVRYYPAVIAAAGNGFGVVFPDFPGCVTLGATVAQAAREATEALALHVEGMAEDKEPLPSPTSIDAPLPDWASESVGGTRVLVPVEVSARAARVNITLDEALLGRIDAAASEGGFTRSGFLAQAAREKLARRAA